MAAARQLAELGYQYVPGPSGLASDLVLRQVADSSKGFQWEGQEKYDQLGDCVMAYCAERLTDLCGLEPLPVPAAAPEGAPRSTIYATPGLRERAEPILVLICGAPPGGAAGVWGRKLCINATLHEGAMYDYVFRAQKLGWSVVVANPNDNLRGEERIPGSRCAHEHILNVWDAYIQEAAATSVLIVAHSYGACATAYLLKSKLDQLERIKAIALTDGWVNPPGNMLREALPERTPTGGSAAFLAEVAAIAPRAFEPAAAAVARRLREVARDFVASPAPPGTPAAADRRGDGVACVSAGHEEHPSTTFAATEVVFEFLQQGLAGAAAAANDELRSRCRAAGL